MAPERALMPVLMEPEGMQFNGADRGHRLGAGCPVPSGQEESPEEKQPGGAKRARGWDWIHRRFAAGSGRGIMAPSIGTRREDLKRINPRPRR